MRRMYRVLHANPAERRPQIFPTFSFNAAAGILLVFLTCGLFAHAQTDSGLGSPYGTTLTPQSAQGAQTLPDQQQSSEYSGQQSESSGQLVPDATRSLPLPEGVTLRNPPNSTNDFAGERNDRSMNPKLPQTPAPLTPFQRLIAASTGKILPIFGATLFSSSVPSTFAPVDRVPVTPEYVIGPGDQLLVRVWGQVTLDSRFTVDRSGNIYIPQVGAVSVAGLPFSQIEQYLRSRIARNFRNFDINVNIGQLRSIQVFVVGEARRPGNYTVSSLSTLVNALFASGGPAPVGSLRDIQVKRGGATITDFDLYDLLLKGDKSKDIQLVSGDVIYIPPAGATVAVAGSVDVPALYELKGESTVEDAIGLAGGFSALAENRKVRIERIDEQRTRSILDVNLDQAGKSTPLHNGDIVIVEPIVGRYKDMVTLRGNVANPNRYLWFPGMRVRDLIPDKDALLTRDYWQHHNHLGMPMLDATPEIRREGIAMTPLQPLTSDASQPTTNVPPADNDTAIYAPQNAGSAIGNDYAVLQARRGNPTAGDTYISPQAGAIPLQGPPTGRENGSSSVSVGVTAAAKTFPPRNTVVLSAPDIDWAYAVIERLDQKDLTTRLLPFNLGKVILDKDESQNYELQPGDVVTIFSKADIRVPQVQQTKYVKLEGEFSGAGIYSVGANETLRQLVARAGGLSASAYLYGSEFTRESTRAQQQERINDYASNLEHSANLEEANTANAGGPLDILAVQSSVRDARSVAAKLRQLRASGRIVLELKPDSRGAADLPDLPLEDGDRFVVPSVPSNVDVYGAVYNQNSFLYDPKRRAGDYLREAGGAIRTADKRREFIVRADGSIVSRQYSSSFFSGGFEGTRMNPGDAIVLPETVYRRSALRQLVDISTIIGQLGLGAVAVNTIH